MENSTNASFNSFGQLEIFFLLMNANRPSSLNGDSMLLKFFELHNRLDISTRDYTELKSALHCLEMIKQQTITDKAIELANTLYNRYDAKLQETKPDQAKIKVSTGIDPLNGSYNNQQVKNSGCFTVLVLLIVSFVFIGYSIF